MSAYVKGPFRSFGTARPEVVAAARIVQRAGWRVTSIVRPAVGICPGPNHAKGIALDIAPMEGGVGGFGPKTGSEVARLLLRNLPNHSWLVVGENNHFHVQVKPEYSGQPGHVDVGVLVAPGKPVYSKRIGATPADLRPRETVATMPAALGLGDIFDGFGR